MNRISFSKQDALMIYEWGLAIKDIVDCDCGVCPVILKRLEKALGEDGEHVKQMVEDHSY